MVIIQPDNCQLCVHSQVCGIKQTVQSMKDAMRLNVPMDKSVNDYIEITVKCKHYQSTVYNWNTITASASSINYDETSPPFLYATDTNTSNTIASTSDLSVQDALNNLKSIKEKE